MKKALVNSILSLMVLGLVFITGSAWAEDLTDDGAEVTFTLDNPPHIDVTTAVDSTELDMDTLGAVFIREKIAKCTWLVNSNNGFDINFSGSSVSDTNVAQSYPSYTKQDYSADGLTVTDRYDHLATTFGVVITGHESVETAATWGDGDLTGAGSEGTPENLVLALSGTETPAVGSPDEAIGTIMTSDDAGTATVELYARGVASQQTQSGVYTASATLTVTIDQQGDAD